MSRESTRAPLTGTRPAGTHDEAAASREVRDMFTRIAPHYDLLNHMLSLRFDVIWRKRLARRFGPILARPEARILDLCCGTGDLALSLANWSPASGKISTASRSASLIAADFAHPMLVRAREKSAGRRRRIEFAEADALALPFAGGAFDLVTTAFGFRNLANYAAGLLEVRRVLAPGGSLAILEFAEPGSALLRQAFGVYFHRVLPAIGTLVSGHAHAYRYLPQSVRRFPRPAELAELMAQSGFFEVAFESWTAGIVTLFTARIPVAN